MKKTFLFTLLVLLITATLHAQYCGGSGNAVCTPGGPYPTLGFYPSYDSIPCAVIGQAYDQKIDMQIPATVPYNGTTATITSIKIDSINNLPCSLCWRTNNANNTFAGNSTGCVRVSGTTFDAAGQYNLRIRITVSATVLGFPATISNQDASQFGVKFYLRVQAPGGVCTPVDTNSAGRNAATPGSITVPAIIGPGTVCSNSSATLSATGGYDTYVWSTGALTQSINVSSAGTYTVTVYANCASATASQTVTSIPIAANISAGGPLTFCSGGNVVLTAAAGNSAYAWSTGATTQSITVSTSGTYSVTATNGSCTATDSKVVTVTSNNLSPVITPPSANICAGGSVTLDAGAGYDSYVWSTTDNTQSTTVNSGNTYTVTVMQGTCTGTASAVVTLGNFPVAVNITPAGPVNACAGDQVTLDAGAGYNSYNWSSGGGTQSAVVTTSGSYVVTVVQNGCIGKDTVVVNVHPLPDPVITPSSISICDGQTATLDAGAGFSSYQWSNNSTTQSIVVSNAGNYDVTVTQNGCTGTTQQAAVVNVTSVPDATITLTSNNVLHTAPGAASYTWYHNQTQISNATDSVYTVPAGTFGLYTVIAANGICADTASITISSINDLASVTDFNLMPNPAKDNLLISYNALAAGETQLLVFDLSGKLVMQIASGYKQAGKYEYNIPVGNFAQGVYVLTLQTENGRFNTRFIKQ
ncbi:MAG: T9SS type A sorting domain-containing protein [Chitinophagales bacterium]